METQSKEGGRFYCTYQNQNGREHTIICGADEVHEQRAFHVRHGHSFSVCPAEVVESQEFV